MRKIAFVLILLVACVSVVACGGGSNAPSNTSGGGGGGGTDQTTPDGTARMFLAAWEAGDAGKIADLFAPDEKEEQKTKFESILKAINGRGNKPKGTIEPAKVEGETATFSSVSWEVDKDGKEVDKSKSPARTTKLVKKDGKWWATGK